MRTVLVLAAWIAISIAIQIGCDHLNGCDSPNQCERVEPGADWR